MNDGSREDMPNGGAAQPNLQRSLRLRREQMQMALMARLRAYFFAGILVTAPIGITVYLAWPVAVLAGALLVLLGRVPDTDR